jgi:hypothetical protein
VNALARVVPGHALEVRDEPLLAVGHDRIVLARLLRSRSSDLQPLYCCGVGLERLQVKTELILARQL